MSTDDSDDVHVRTPWGPLSVPRSIFNEWQEHGWPEADVLQRMAESGTVEAVDG